MNLNEIKSALNVNVLNLKQAQDQDGQWTDWFKSWDNSSRTRIIAHRDVSEVLGTSSNLELKSENKISASGKAYTQHTIIEVSPFEGETMVF